MNLRKRMMKNLVILMLVAVLLVPMFPAARAEGQYPTIDFSQSVLDSRINQKVSGGCAVASMATIESFMHGTTSAEDKDTVYQAVLEANGDDNFAYWDNVGYLVYDYVDWDVIYQNLTIGVPSIIHRTKGSNAVQHWAVVAGYNGSETELEWEKFIVVDVYLGTGLKDIRSAEAWSAGCDINWMALRGNGMNISIYPKTLMDWGEAFYGSISRMDTPGEQLSASQEEKTDLITAPAEVSDLQRWHFVRQSDGGYVIESVHSGLVLTLQDGDSSDGTPVCLAQEKDPDSQHWFIYQTQTGYMLQCRGTGKAISLYPAEENRGPEQHTFKQSPQQNLNIHVHSYTQTEVDATCEEPSYTRYQCSACDDTYRVDGTTAPLGHQWQKGDVQEGNCQHTPMTAYLCARCQQTKVEYEDKIYSDWTEEKPANMAQDQLETQTQYRFRDRFGLWGEPEENQLLYVKQWPEAFDRSSEYYTQYNQSPVVGYQSDTQWVNVVLDEQVGYLYYHWCGGTGFSGTCTEAFPTFHVYYSTTKATETDDTGAYYCPEAAAICPYAIWYYQVPVYQQTYLVHQKLASTDQWTEWSAWSNTKVEATDDRQVEQRTLYRYVTNFGDHKYSASDDSTCNVCGLEREVVKLETTPMYRLYNPNSGEHFYTGSAEERGMLESLGWQYEGVAWNAPTKTGAPVYRLFNPNNGDHHYTMSEAERDMLVSVGWQYEGIAWNSASPSNIPLFRLFNPNADCGSHHYTGSEEERDYLVSLGWQYEGIGWYGMLK